jgi:hypothetical protein
LHKLRYQARATYSSHFETASRHEWWRSCFRLVTVLAGVGAVAAPYISQAVEAKAPLATGLTAAGVVGLFMANKWQEEAERERARYHTIAARWRVLSSRADALHDQLKAEYKVAPLSIADVRAHLNGLYRSKAALDLHPDSVTVRKDFETIFKRCETKKHEDVTATKKWAVETR